MYKKINSEVSIIKIAKFLGQEYKGKDFNIKGVTSLDNIKDSHLLFYTETSNSQFNLKEKKEFDFSTLTKYSNIVIITEVENASKIPCVKFLSKNPRLDFKKILNHFFVKAENIGIHKTAVIEKGAKIAKNVQIGAHTYIEKDVEIGENTRILHNVVITGKVTIGNNCVIKSNTTVGSEGFNFTRDGDKIIHFPHIGEILIGDNVWLGSNVSVEKSGLDATIIEDNVLVDDLVQIGHNVRVGRGSSLTVGSIILGRVAIGEDCWISPNVTINNGIKIGKGSFICVGSVVTKNIQNNKIVAGSPAREIKTNK